MTAYESKNIAILNIKAVDFRSIVWGISRDEAVNRLNNSVFEGLLEEHILETFILDLMKRGTESHGKNLSS